MRFDAVLLDDLGVLSATADGSLLPYVLELRAGGSGSSRPGASSSTTWPPTSAARWSLG